MPDLRTLVIDDHKNWQKALPRILQRLADKVQVDVAANYGDALRYIKTKAYDLATIDLSLMGGGLVGSPETELLGLELLHAFRSYDHNKQCVLIVLTGYPTADHTRQLLQTYQAYDFIDKSEFDNYRFLEIAKTALKRLHQP